MRRQFCSLFMVAFLSVAAGCAADDTASTTTTASTTVPATVPLRDSTEGPWELTALEIDGFPVELPANQPITLIVEGTRMAGRSLCSRYGLTTGVDQEQFRTVGLRSTRVGECDGATAELDRRYLESIQNATRVRVENATLRLFSPTLSLTYAPLDPIATNSVLGVIWEVESIVIEGATTSLAAGDRPTLSMIAATVELFTGCRVITGPLDRSDTEWVVGLLDYDDGNCEGENVVAQDEALQRIITSGFAPTLEGDELQIKARGGLGLVARAQVVEPPPTTVGADTDDSTPDETTEPEG